MNLSVVLSHPYERSFCHAIASQVSEAAIGSGSTVSMHDLYAESIDPVLTGAEIARRFSLDPAIQAYSAAVASTDLLVVVHPDWWSSPPAILKGWMERVLRPGIAYDWQGEEFEEKEHVPLLTSLGLLVYVTTDRPPDDLPEAIRLFWHDACDYSGMQELGTHFYSDMRHSGHRQRRHWLSQIRQEIRQEVERRCNAG